MIMNKTSLTVAIGVALCGVLASGVSVASTKQQIDRSSDHALTHFDALKDSHRELVSRAAGVLVFGRVTKGGVGVGGEYGEGELQVKGQVVGYYSLTSASVGLTLGLAKHQEVILFMTQAALDKFTSSHGWSAGGDSAIAVVSKGAGGEYDSSTMNKPILGFIFGEKGVIGDLSLEGSKITQIKN
jgi:lipid-binding SYLF domain-containing protein